MVSSKEGMVPAFFDGDAKKFSVFLSLGSNL